MLSLPRFIYRIKVEKPCVYLWRMLRIALPLFVAGIVAVIGLAPEFARVVI